MCAKKSRCSWESAGVAYQALEAASAVDRVEDEGLGRDTFWRMAWDLVAVVVSVALDEVAVLRTNVLCAGPACAI